MESWQSLHERADVLCLCKSLCMVNPKHHACCVPGVIVPRERLPCDAVSSRPRAGVMPLHHVPHVKSMKQVHNSKQHKLSPHSCKPFTREQASCLSMPTSLTSSQNEVQIVSRKHTHTHKDLSNWHKTLGTQSKEQAHP